MDLSGSFFLMKSVRISFLRVQMTTWARSAARTSWIAWRASERPEGGHSMGTTAKSTKSWMFCLWSWKLLCLPEDTSISLSYKLAGNYSSSSSISVNVNFIYLCFNFIPSPDQQVIPQFPLSCPYVLIYFGRPENQWCVHDADRTLGTERPLICDPAKKERKRKWDGGIRSKIKRYVRHRKFLVIEQHWGFIQYQLSQFASIIRFLLKTWEHVGNVSVTHDRPTCLRNARASERSSTLHSDPFPKFGNLQGAFFFH